MEIRQIKKEIDIRPASYFRRECRKYREIIFKFKVHQDLLFIHIQPSDMTSFIYWFVSNYILKKFDPLKHDTEFLAICWQICCARRSTAAIWILSIYRSLKWTWFVDFCGNGDSTCRHCVIITQKTKNKRTMMRYIASIYIVNVLYF
jgi:hypothetical protein